MKDNSNKIQHFIVSTLLILGISLITLEVAVRILKLKPMPGPYEGMTYFNVKGGRVECLNPEVSRAYFYQNSNPFPGCVFYSSNHYGFRKKENIQNKKFHHLFRVIAVGDSFTQGFGVLEEDVWTHLLETQLTKAGVKAEVLNAGVPGSGLFQYQEMLKRIRFLEPDWVIIGVNLNDVAEFPTSLIIEKIQRRWNWGVRKYSRFLDYFLFHLERNLSARENIRAIQNSFDFHRKQAFRNFVQEVKEFSNKNNIKTLFLIFPVFYDFKNYAFQGIHEELAKVLEEENILKFDFLTKFKGLHAKQFWISKNDQHPNETAQKIFAEVVFQVIQHQ